MSIARYLSKLGALLNSNGQVQQSGLAANVAGNGPAFKAYKSGSGNTVVSNNTYVKVILDAEAFDTNSNFDSTTNYRFQPTVAGYYQINGAIASNWNTAQFTHFEAILMKNTSTIVAASTMNATSSAQWYGWMQVNDLVYLNGSTDYLELYLWTGGGTNTTYSPGLVYTFMSGFLARAA